MNRGQNVDAWQSSAPALCRTFCKTAWCGRLPGMVLALTILLFSGGAGAQGRSEVTAGQFDFSLPGARSLAMGGAFLAVARDATAAYSNPAGLVFLTEKEVSVEVRDWTFTNTAIDRGHGFGMPSGIGIDTLPGLIEQEATADRQGLSFLSFIYPMNKWTVGFFRHEFPRFLTRKRLRGAFFDCAGGFRADNREPFCSENSRGDGIDRILPKDQWIEIDIFSWGASAAYQFDRLPLAVGVSLLYHSFDFNASTTLYRAREESKFTPPDYSPDNIEGMGRLAGDDTDLGINVGFLLESGRWSLGGAFRHGPEFKYSIRRTAGPQHPSVLAGRNTIGGELNSQQDLPFKVPSTWAIGTAHRLSDTVTLSLQYDRVRFSHLTRDFTEPFLVSGEAEALAQGLKTDDAHRLRLGFEKLWPQASKIWALRAGSWYDTDHRTRFVADPATGRPVPRSAILFPEGEDELHYSFGGGIVLKDRFQIDAAVDVSDAIETFSLSMVIRLPRKRTPQDRAMAAFETAMTRLEAERLSATASPEEDDD